MNSWLKFGAVALVMVGVVLLFPESRADKAAGSSDHCIGCHDFGPESPAHRVMASSHKLRNGGEEEAGPRSCSDCHGDSAAHASAPTRVAPDVSFGPRWSSSAADHDASCLACHKVDTAHDWENSIHMVNNVTCVTCHDIHTGGDRVVFSGQQAEVCTICHKVQKQGIHGLEAMARYNPPCSSCHNPHAHESAENAMLHNDSRGCRSCHDLVKLAQSDRVSDRTRNYHQLMLRPGYTCVQCHRDVAHAPADSVPAWVPSAARKRDVTLFYPGLADRDWLLQEHPGSQPLRQGANCRQCHRGEEEAMGRAQAGDFEPVSRNLEVSFDRDADSLRMVLEWRGSRDEKTISMMWGDGSNAEFRRGGCFAACHSDLPGMSRDRGQQTGKYLRVSRLQQRSVGVPPIVRDQAELAELMAQNDFAALWRIDLASGRAGLATVLDDVHWQPGLSIRASTSYADGRWTVKLRRAIGRESSQLMTFDPQGVYTFAIALHGADNPGARHWVSLPMTLSYTGNDTDFRIDASAPEGASGPVTAD